MELCLFTCPGPSGAIHAPHHQSVSANGSQPSGPVVPLMSPETSRSPLVFVAHLSFCVFSHPYSPLQDAPSESPTVQPTLAKEAGSGENHGAASTQHCGIFSCSHRNTCGGSWAWHLLEPTFLARGPAPVHFRVVPYTAPAWPMCTVSVSPVWDLQLHTLPSAMHSSNYSSVPCSEPCWHQSQQPLWVSLLHKQEANDSHPPESSLFLPLAGGFC